MTKASTSLPSLLSILFCVSTTITATSTPTQIASLYDAYCTIPLNHLPDSFIFNTNFFDDSMVMSQENSVYDSIYREYTTIIKDQSIYKGHTRLMAFLTGKIFAAPTVTQSTSELTILEIGSGLGDTTALLYEGAKNVNPALNVTITGIDISEAMIHSARLCNTNPAIIFDHSDIAMIDAHTQYDCIAGFFAPFNYAQTIDELETMVHVIVDRLKPGGIGAFLFNVNNQEIAQKFSNLDGIFTLLDNRGVEFTSTFNPLLLSDETHTPFIMNVTIFNGDQKIAFTNYVWSERSISTILDTLGCTYTWFDGFNTEALAGYEKTKVNKLLIVQR
jgi:SAM-dependent methyltransferase